MLCAVQYTAFRHRKSHSNKYLAQNCCVDDMLWYCQKFWFSTQLLCWIIYYWAEKYNQHLYAVSVAKPKIGIFLKAQIDGYRRLHFIESRRKSDFLKYWPRNKLGSPLLLLGGGSKKEKVLQIKPNSSEAKGWESTKQKRIKLSNWDEVGFLFRMIRKGF